MRTRGQHWGIRLELHLVPLSQRFSAIISDNEVKLVHNYFCRHESILSKSWQNLNVTIFGERNSSEDISVDTLNLNYATGFVLSTHRSLNYPPIIRDLEEDFTSVSGFLMEDHFYGTVYMRDTVHYLEPHDRKSRDMHIFGEGLKTLLHK